MLNDHHVNKNTIYLTQTNVYMHSKSSLNTSSISARTRNIIRQITYLTESQPAITVCTATQHNTIDSILSSSQNSTSHNGVNKTLSTSVICPIIFIILVFQPVRKIPTQMVAQEKTNLVVKLVWLGELFHQYGVLHNKTSELDPMSSL